MHLLMDHITEYIHEAAPRGLGLFSEQASEAIHHDFLLKWKDVSVLDIRNPKYSPHLFRAVTTYNSQHV